jgi:16S rRNA C967 or C1407 C5-methylase (RsmB/RsmF family)
MARHAENLFDGEAERAAFLEALASGECREQAVVALRESPALGALPRKRPAPWQPPWVLRIDDSIRAAKHPLHRKGAIYSLDLSSVFAASLMLAIEAPPRRVLDLCAAPGGKSVFAWRAFGPEVLVCNETIRKRCGPLIDNLERCGIAGSCVASADPSVWARRFPAAFDLVIVDAPCSGQSLLAKGDAAPGCFEPGMIDMCHSRQRRILGNAARCVRPGGHLLYMTCAYVVKENEKPVAWLLREYDWLEAVAVASHEAHRSRHAGFPAYRLFPHQAYGAGGFACLLRHTGPAEGEPPPLDTMPVFWRQGQPPNPNIKPRRRTEAG